MIEHKTDAVLLSYDVKGDLIQTNGEPHSRYIQIVHRITGHHLFIIDAERYFKDVLNKNFDPVSPEILSVEPILLDIENRDIVKLSRNEVLYYRILNKIFKKTGFPLVNSTKDKNLMENLQILNDFKLIPSHLLISCAMIRDLAEDDEYRLSEGFSKNLDYIIKKLEKILIDLSLEE
jgi:hypothetical protein